MRIHCLINLILIRSAERKILNEHVLRIRDTCLILTTKFENYCIINMLKARGNFLPDTHFILLLVLLLGKDTPACSGN